MKHAHRLWRVVGYSAGFLRQHAAFGWTVSLVVGVELVAAGLELWGRGRSKAGETNAGTVDQAPIAGTGYPVVPQTRKRGG